MRRRLGLLFLASALACSDEDPYAGLPPIEPICDGSDDVRLVFDSWRGFGISEFASLNGSAYLAIDGQCHYWLGSDTLEGLRVGTLDASRAEQAAQELHFGRYASVPEYRGTSCFDCGKTAIRDDTGTLVSNGVGEGNEAPRVWSEALVASSRLLHELEAQSERAWGPTRLLARPVLDPERAPPDPVFSWTAPLDLEDLAIGPPFRPEDELAPGASVLVEDEPTLGLLEQLRESALRYSSGAFAINVRSARGSYYQLFVREDPPEPIASELRDLRTY